MAGYVGFSKSVNAVNAEQTGIYPLTTAVKKLANVLKISQSQSRQLLESVGPCEWHHTGSWYNQTDYYSVVDIVGRVKDGELAIPSVTKKEKVVTVSFRAVAEWTEWGGTRKHPTPYHQSREVEISYKAGGAFLTLDGQRKKVDNVKIIENGKERYAAWVLEDKLNDAR